MGTLVSHHMNSISGPAPAGLVSVEGVHGFEILLVLRTLG